MRILAVAPYYPPEGGGLERYAHGILSGLASRGHEVAAAAFTAGPPGTRQAGAVEVLALRPALHAGNTPIDLRFPSRLRALVRRRRPDVVVAHAPVPFPAQAAAAVAHREEVPLVVTYHAGRLRGSSPLLDAAAALDRWTLERRMLARAARLVAVGAYVRDHALARHRGRTAVIPPGVDAARYAPSGAPAAQEILFVGPLSSAYRWKGIDALWEAFCLVRERRPAARLRLVGDGDRRQEFQERARALGEGTVRIPGRVGEDELVRRYQEAAVTVLPSTTDAESFGMVLAEANACGRPVVASRVGGIPDFVRDGDNGLLAHPGDPYDLAEKILAVLDDPDAAARMGERGRERVLREHGWGDLARRTETVLEEAVRA